MCKMISENFGFLNSVQEAYKLITEYETNHTVKLLVTRLTKNLETLVRELLLYIHSQKCLGIGVSNFMLFIENIRTRKL